MVASLPLCVIVKSTFVFLLVANSSCFARERVFVRQICGPRAVYSVLQHFGKEVPLAALVGEMQPYGGSATTMQDLKIALESRGLFVRAIRVGKRTKLVGQFPVIVCIKNYFEEPHFAVINSRDSQSGEILVDCGEGCFLTGEWNDIMSICEKEVLVVTDRSGLDSEEIFEIEAYGFELFMTMFSAIGLFVVFLLSFFLQWKGTSWDALLVCCLAFSVSVLA